MQTMNRLLNIVRQFHRLLSAAAQESGQGNVPRHGRMTHDPAWDTDPAAALAESERLIEDGGRCCPPHFKALDRLPRNIRKLPSTHIDITDTQISDLSGLAERPDLESLVLNDHVSDISGLDGLTALTRLVANTSPVTDLSPLRGCRSLTNLQLNVAHVADLSPLADLPSLESLDLWSYKGQALWPHGRVQKLSFVHAAERSADLAPLVTWKALSSLNLDRGTIKGALPVLPTIRFLGLPGCDDTHFAALSGYTALETLFAYDSSVSELAPLAGCIRLETVNLSNSRITDIDPLVDKPALKDVSIAGTGVTHIARLSWLPKLGRLLADETAVADIAGWNPDSTIRFLSLRDTKVSDLSLLAGTGIQSLNIAGTPVSDLSFIAKMQWLHGLNFARTQVSEIEPILAHAGLLYDVSDLDYRDRAGYYLHFEDTPLARSSEALHKISLMDGNTDAGDRQKALRELYGIAPSR
jgi:Leucine-rich repeat (LRR) protein